MWKPGHRLLIPTCLSFVLVVNILGNTPVASAAQQKTATAVETTKKSDVSKVQAMAVAKQFVAALDTLRSWSPSKGVGGAELIDTNAQLRQNFVNWASQAVYGNIAQLRKKLGAQNLPKVIGVQLTGVTKNAVKLDSGEYTLSYSMNAKAVFDKNGNAVQYSKFHLEISYFKDSNKWLITHIKTL